MSADVNPDNLPIVPHSDHGDEECCGCLYPVERGDLADLVCNECGALIQTVPIGEVEPTLLRSRATPVEFARLTTAVNLYVDFNWVDHGVLRFYCIGFCGIHRRLQFSKVHILEND